MLCGLTRFLANEGISACALIAVLSTSGYVVFKSKNSLKIKVALCGHHIFGETT